MDKNSKHKRNMRRMFSLFFGDKFIEVHFFQVSVPANQLHMSVEFRYLDGGLTRANVIGEDFSGRREFLYMVEVAEKLVRRYFGEEVIISPTRISNNWGVVLNTLLLWIYIDIRKISWEREYG